jgi:hypothetical protein
MMKIRGHITSGRLPSLLVKSRRWWKRDTLWTVKLTRQGPKLCPSDADEAIIYEDFFVVGLLMPPHPTLADVLVRFQAQLQQLMPNAIARPSKYFWAIGSFGGIPSSNAFVKRSELHY